MSLYKTLKKSTPLTHYSPSQGLKTIDPGKRGSGVDVSRNVSEHPISYFYVQGAEPESVVSDRAKSKYSIDLPDRAKIYDIGTDPERHIAGLREESKGRMVNPGVITNDDIHDRLKSLGFHGFKDSTHGKLSGVVGLYGPSDVGSEESVGKSEMEKGTSPLKALGIAAGLVGAAMGPVQVHSQGSNDVHQAQKQYVQNFNNKMLSTIGAVESNHGLHTKHKALSGPIHQGEHAFGTYGLTPAVIRETVSANPNLKQHRKLTNMSGVQIADYINKTPGLEKKIAETHLNRLKQHFGNNPAMLGFSWLSGIEGTYKAVKKGKDIKNHWHTKKILNQWNKK